MNIGRLKTLWPVDDQNNDEICTWIDYFEKMDQIIRDDFPSISIYIALRINHSVFCLLQKIISSLIIAQSSSAKAFSNLAVSNAALLSLALSSSTSLLRKPSLACKSLIITVFA